MRVVFMGTPDFAVGTLKALIEAGHDVAAVVTQPDKPKGRGKELLMTPVKAEAVKAGIPVQSLKRLIRMSSLSWHLGSFFRSACWSSRSTAV